jgi:hypothetical protein
MEKKTRMDYFDELGIAISKVYDKAFEIRDNFPKDADAMTKLVKIIGEYYGPLF